MLTVKVFNVGTRKTISTLVAIKLMNVGFFNFRYIDSNFTLFRFCITSEKRHLGSIEFFPGRLIVSCKESFVL